MKKKNLLMTVVTAIGFAFTLSLQAQNVVIESVYPNGGESNIQHVFNKKDYKEARTLQNGAKVFLKSQKQKPADGPAKGAEIALTLILNYDNNVYSSPYINVVNKQKDYEIWYEGKDTITQLVEAGTYDIISEFFVSGETGAYAYVVKELVDISADTVIAIKAADAKNHIITEIYNEKGELTEPGELINDTTFVSGNIDDQLIARSVKSEWYYSNFTGNRGNNSRLLDFYISDVSNRYMVTESRLTLGKDKDGYYFNKFTLDNGINASDTLKNNPDQYVLHEEHFQLTPQSNGWALPGIRSGNVVDGSEGSGWEAYKKKITYLNGEGMKIYLDNQLSDANSANRIDMLAYPRVIEKFDTIINEWKQKDEIDTSFAPIPTESAAIALNSSRDVEYLITAQGNFRFVPDGNHLTFIILPEHPAFSFVADNDNPIMQSDNCPIAFCNLLNYFDKDMNKKMTRFEPKYLGRYGENRGIDTSFFSTEVKYNNEVVYSGTGHGIYDFMYQWAQDNHPDGVFEINMINNNVKVDNVIGENITTITYDQTKEDWTPPQLQMLQFRDISGKVTDRFNSSEEGIVELAAGDFEYVSDWPENPEHFEYREGNTVDFYYAPIGSKSWTRLGLTKMPEYFAHGFGDFYHGSLSSIQQTGDDVWYDVKVVCTDSTGNSMTQIISPAFNIDKISGIENPAMSSGLSVYPNPFSQQINVTLPENIKGAFSFTIFDLLGQPIYEGTKESDNHSQFTIDGSFLKAGTYFLIIKNNNQVNVSRIVKK